MAIPKVFQLFILSMLVLSTSVDIFAQTELPPQQIPPPVTPTPVATASVVSPPIPTTVTTIPAQQTITTISAPQTVTTVSAPPPMPTSRQQLLPPTSQFQKWMERRNRPQNPPGIRTASGNNPARPPVRIPPPPRPVTYEESQKVMLETAPPPLVPPPPDSNIAFNTMLQQNTPLTPQQVVILRQQIDRAQRAASIPPNIPPKPVSTTIMVNLAPGTTPPPVRLAQGYVSSLVFIDTTGMPWPIAEFVIAEPKAVNVQWDGKSNIILLQAISPYKFGNLVVRLIGLPTPITLELISGQRVVDYRVDIHVSGIGPNTKEIPIGTTLPNSANQLLLGVLDGIAPAGSKILVVRGADAQAYALGDRLYFRTRLTVLSPGWMGTMTSPDGMHAYELPTTSSILVSRYGEPVELKIEGY